MKSVEKSKNLLGILRINADPLSDTEDASISMRGCLAYGHWRRSLTIAVAAELRLRQRTETATRPDRDAQFRAPVAFRVLELSAPDIEAKNLKMKKEQGADL